MKFTDEQAEAIRVAGTGESFVLDAPAGSGKSSTAHGMINEIMNSGGTALYLVFNTSAKDDAMKKFPKGTVRTTASFGWRHCARDHEARMNWKTAPRVTAEETAKIAGLTQPLDISGERSFAPNLIAMLALDTIRRFCYTGDLEIQPKHVPPPEIGMSDALNEYLRQHVAAWAKKIWKQTQNPDSKHRFTGDYAFKLFVLSEPNLSVDTVIVDEAQDSNGCTEKLIKSQWSQQIIVGDPAQQLYSWRGATDIMGKFGGPRLKLTQSFRFGNAVAEEAAKWLSYTQTGITIRGLDSLDSHVGTGDMDRPDTVLCRTNIGTMQEGIRFLAEGKRVAVVGGTSDLKNLTFAASDLMAGRPCRRPELMAFKTWSELLDFTAESGGADLKPLVTLVQTLGISKIIEACDQIVDERYGNPDVIVSTAHKAKGREWDNVLIGEDFESFRPKPYKNPVTGEEEQGEIARTEAMLNYVAVTRAKRRLDRGGLAWIDDYCLESDSADTDVPVLEKR